MNNQLEELRRTSGSLLRFDHTYKASKSLGVSNGKVRVYLKSSVLVVMNENGEVLSTKVVPADEKDHIIDVLTEILQVVDKLEESLPTAVFTDNVAKDSIYIKKLVHDLLNRDVLVLQVQCIHTRHSYCQLLM